MIANKASETLLDRHLAALVVASENGINIQKYSTPDERAQSEAPFVRVGRRQRSLI